MAVNFRYRKTLDNFLRQSIAISATTGRMVGLNIPRYVSTTNELYNLVGTYGSFDTDTDGDGVADGWVGAGRLYGAIASLETSRATQGLKAQRITSTATDTSATRRIQMNVNVTTGRCYLIMCDFVNDGITAGQLVIVNAAENAGITSMTSTSNKTLYVRYRHTNADTNIVLRLQNIANQGSVGWVQFDALRMYEIDNTIYDKIGVDTNYTGENLAKIFPYTEPNVLSIYRPQTSYDPGKLLTIEEGTTNIMPAGSENFVTGWINNVGSTVIVTDSQPDPFGQNKAYRIQTSGGTSDAKYLTPGSTFSTGIYSTQVWVRARDNPVAVMDCNNQNKVVNVYKSDGWKLVKFENTSVTAGTSYFLRFRTINWSERINTNLDFDVCYPQVEQKAYCTSYVPPAQTRQLELYTIPTYGTGDIKNLLSYNQSTVELDVSGFMLNQPSTTISRDTTEKYQGGASLKVVTAGSVGYEGIYTSTNVVASKNYAASVNVKGASGVVYLIIREKTSTGTIVGSSVGVSVTLNGTWQKISGTKTFGSTGTIAEIMVITSTTAQAIIYYVDNLQLESSSIATYFMPGGYQTPTKPIVNLLTENQSSIEEGLTGFNAVSSTLSKDTTEKLFGQSSLKVVTSNLATTEGFYSQSFAPVTGGRPYVFSTYIKGAGTVKLQIAEFNASGGAVYTNNSPIFTLNSSWKRYILPFIPQPTTTKVLYTVYTNTMQSTTFYADGLQLEEAKKYPVNLLDDSQANLETVSATPTAGATISIDKDQFVFGTGSLKVVTAGAGSAEGIVNSALVTPIIPSKTYIASAYIKTSANMVIQITEFNSSGSLVGISTQDITANSDWQRVSVTRTFDASGVSYYISIKTSGTIATTFWVDGVQLEEGLVATEWQPPYSGATAFCLGDMLMPIVNSNEGTIEMDYYFSGSAPVSMFLVSFIKTWSTTVDNIYAYVNTNALIVGSADYNGNTSATLQISQGINRVAFKWGNGKIVLVLNGKTTSISTNRSPQMLQDLMLLGYTSTYPSQTDNYFGNIRISNIARPDSELANTWNQKLTVDKYTTWLTDFNNRLSNIAA